MYSLKNKSILPNIKQALELIKRSLDKCDPLPSQPKTYKFNQNIVLGKLAKILELKKYTIDTQVLNYNGKIVGVITSDGSSRGYIPCFPSSPLIDLGSDYKWIDEITGNSYERTIYFLKKMHLISKKKILSKPALKIIEDGLIVGILTQTNQFVPISPPVQDTFGDDIPSQDSYNYTIIDKESITSKKVDNNRVNYIRKIKLETQFFNVFRNTIRMLLGEFKNRRTREKIEEIIASNDLYLNKLGDIDEEIRELTRDVVVYADMPEDNIVDNVTTCYKGDSTCPSKPFCVVSENEEIGCKLVIPKINLINGQDNEKVYYGRLADEILRYSRIRSFIFQPRSFLLFGNLKYNLRNDEIILLQSLLIQDYFEDLVPAPVNKYIRYNTYDNVQPLESITYSSEIEADKKENEIKDSIECERVVDDVAGVWRSVFPNDSLEFKYTNSPKICTFQVILDVIKNNDPLNLGITKENLKEILAEEYNYLYEEHKKAIQDTLILQGKQKLIRMITEGQIKLYDLIVTNEYYLTDLDIWVLAKKYNIPLVIFSGTNLRENGKKILVANSDDTDSYYFIKSPGVKKDIAPEYKLVARDNGKILKIQLNTISTIIQREIRESKDVLIDYLNTFSLVEAKKKIPNKENILDKIQKPRPKKKIKLILKE